FTVSEDAKVQRLQSSATGLNFVTADVDDLAEGQKVTLSLSPTSTSEKKDVENVSGTLIKIEDSGTKLTLRLTVPSGKEPPEPAGKHATLVSIRSLPPDKDK